MRSNVIIFKSFFLFFRLSLIQVDIRSELRFGRLSRRGYWLLDEIEKDVILLEKCQREFKIRHYRTSPHRKLPEYTSFVSEPQLPPLVLFGLTTHSKIEL